MIDTKKLLSFFVAFFICFASVTTATANGAEMIGESRDNAIATIKSEYQMAIEETQRLETVEETNWQPCLESVAQAKTPLEEYKEAFDIRAAMGAEALRGMGYNDAEIDVLQKYNNGECSFEEAATRASTVLTSSLTSTEHTAKKYTVNYYWSWDKTPVGLGQDGFAMGVYGIDNNSTGFVTKLNSSNAVVTYYYEDNNTYYHTEYPSKDVTGSTVSAKFDSYKLDNTGDRWVWAKSGYIIMTVAPAVSGSKTFAAVRAAGSYGHSSKSSAKLNISVSVNVTTGNILTTFTISSPASATVTTYGKRQTIFIMTALSI